MMDVEKCAFGHTEMGGAIAKSTDVPRGDIASRIDKTACSAYFIACVRNDKGAMIIC